MQDDDLFILFSFVTKIFPCIPLAPDERREVAVCQGLVTGPTETGWCDADAATDKPAGAQGISKSCSLARQVESCWLGNCLKELGSVLGPIESWAAERVRGDGVRCTDTVIGPASGCPCHILDPRKLPTAYTFFLSAPHSSLAVPQPSALSLHISLPHTSGKDDNTLTSKSISSSGLENELLELAGGHTLHAEGPGLSPSNS